MDKSFCFFFQKEALSFLKKRNKKLLSIKEARMSDPALMTAEDLLAAADLPRPPEPEGLVGPAIPNPDSLGDAGHRG